MTQPPEPSCAAGHDAAAEAAAECVLALYRLQQQAESANTARDLMASGWIVVGVAMLFGGLIGALMGAVRGHAVAAGLSMAIVGGLLALIRQHAI